jgi:hypothetical protein
MGMESVVSFPAAPPAWSAARDVLSARGVDCQVCMIDGELAFPDEQPSEPWRELRIRMSQGMITVRREGNRLMFVTWGNADENLRAARNALASAFAEAGGGRIES